MCFSVKVPLNWKGPRQKNSPRLRGVHIPLASVCMGGVLVLGGLLVPQTVTGAISDLESGHRD